MKYIKNLNNFLNESTVELPNIPNTITMWHGGNIDELNNDISYKSGRYEYGPGLYLSDNLHMVLNNYAKGNRKLYLVTVEKGLDLNDALIDFESVKNFINNYIKVGFRKKLIDNLSINLKNDKVPAYRFNNMILNNKALSSSKVNFLRRFLVNNGVDYEITKNPFPNGGNMIVLYNINKIKNIIRINHRDIGKWLDILNTKKNYF